MTQASNHQGPGLARASTRTKTYAQAQKEIFDTLEARGWKVRRDLKVPWAENPSGDLRLWFKPQAVWYSEGNSHSLGGARSTWIGDIRHMSGDDFVVAIDRMFQGRYATDRIETKAKVEVVETVDTKIETGSPCAHKHPPSVPSAPCAAEAARLVWTQTPNGTYALGPSYYAMHGEKVYNVVPDGAGWALYFGSGPNDIDPKRLGHFASPEAAKSEAVRHARRHARVKAERVAREGGAEARETANVVYDKAAGGKKMKPCLPFVRITVDEDRFRACMAWADKIGPLDTPTKVYELARKMVGDQEGFFVFLCDVRAQLRGVAEVALGQRSKVQVGVADLMRIVLTTGAEAFYVVHNHPSGKASPSDADKDLTRTIAEATLPYGQDVTFVNHIIAGLDQFYSFADKKIYNVKLK